MKKAGAVTVILGVLLMIGSLYVARTVKSSTVVSQIAKYVKVDVTRANAGKLLESIDILLDNELTGEELSALTAAKAEGLAEGEQAEITEKDRTDALNARKMAKLAALHGTEYTAKDETLILRGSEKLLKNGFDATTRLCLMLHSYDQVISCVGLAAVLGGGALAVWGGKRRIV